jgi:hypothetical protein
MKQPSTEPPEPRSIEPRYPSERQSKPDERTRARHGIVGPIAIGLSVAGAFAAWTGVHQSSVDERQRREIRREAVKVEVEADGFRLTEETWHQEDPERSDGSYRLILNDVEAGQCAIGSLVTIVRMGEGNKVLDVEDYHISQGDPGLPARIVQSAEEVTC